MLDQYKDIKIKELIKRYPGIIEVLEEYKIDCLHCKIGSCRLKDIIEAENLSMNDEIEFLNKMAKALPY
jgi:iron-sulfur cluster repair protein YtfE (RIC family)